MIPRGGAASAVPPVFPIQASDMTIKISRKIKGYSVAKPDDAKAPTLGPDPVDAIEVARSPGAEVIQMHEKVERQSITKVAWYQKDKSEFVPVPVLGADIFDPRQIQTIQEFTMGGGAVGGKSAKAGLIPVPLSAEARAKVAAAKAKYVSMKQRA